ncbi:unnamed protein product [Cyclocybe aegerita]|uniref:Diphthine--ammonia ligase n=1 Tax=Cyclocybe aegerita TaxID=1973307 RepID=A0A8S0VWY2_CYCAE|nr:unnamed protein product [Cyclocybe aegerita]
MKYVALLSGGKDSCYNLLHCRQNGHELVAAASLGPEPGKEELDSYMYQTVGQDAIEFVTWALDVPLYRQIITGKAVEQGSEYGGRSADKAGGVAGDETEDLHTLLMTVKSRHPEIQGVSVGAILSNYQRVRVEHVCRRLGLTPLCYLWQRNQGELLSEMIQGGMEVVLIKVAGIGLTASHLGKTLAQMQPTLIKLNTLYGSHICGEGGEYESLTLDCPIFKQRINLIDAETVIHSDNGFATVAFLRIKRAELVSKSLDATKIVIPPTLEEEFKAVAEAVKISERAYPMIDSSTNPRGVQEFHHPETRHAASRCLGLWVTVSNVQTKTPQGGLSIKEEVTECFQILAEKLAEHDLQLSNCSIINMCISSIDLFASINAAYSTFFGVSPPARACVCVDLPEGIRVRLECIAFAEKSPAERQVLHVQGLSYWAPANIGPYSQAITANERVFISGQIGLIPSHLALPLPRSLAKEMALASQHVARITSALKENSGGGWEGHIQLTIYWTTESANLSHVKEGHYAIQLPSSPALFLVVKELPKDALVEKQVLLHTGRCHVYEDGESIIERCNPTFRLGSKNFADGSSWRWEVSNMEEDNSSCTVLYLKGDFVNNTARLNEMTADIAGMDHVGLTFGVSTLSGAQDFLCSG